MKTNKLCILLLSLLCMIALAGVAYALTATIGNAKMILYPVMEPQKPYTIERTILVRNVNNDTVKISLTPMGDIENITEIVDQDFLLGPSEEKDARFKINLTLPGKYVGSIGVSFYQENTTKEQGVGLVSNIIIVAKETNQSQVNTSTDKENNSTNTTATNTQTNLGDFIKNNILALSAALLTLICLAGLVAYKQTKRSDHNEKKRRKRQK